MTALTRRSTPVTTTPIEAGTKPTEGELPMNRIQMLLDEIAHGIAAVEDRSAGQPTAAAVVGDLESLAHAQLGTDGDGITVLRRRFSRVHRMLLDRAPTGELIAHLTDLLTWLRDPAPGRQPQGGSVSRPLSDRQPEPVAC